MATDGWYGPAIDNHAPSNAGDHMESVTIGLLHCTQSPPGGFRASSTSYFGHQNYPHFTCDVQLVSGVKTFRVWQHISLRKCAKALSNDSGGVQTNRAGVIQIEVVGYADKPFTNDPVMVEGLKKLMRWIESQTKIPRSCGVKFWAGKYGEDVPERMSYTAWQKYAGWCGHQHAPENEHYDPGAIDIAKLLDVAPAPTPTPTPTPTTGKEISMVIVLDPDSSAQYACDLTTKRHINMEDRAVYIAAGVPYIDGSKVGDAQRRVFLSRLFPIDSNAPA